MSLTLTPLEGIPMIALGDNLPQIILQSMKEMQLEMRKRDILIIAQKIVSKAEGRKVNLKDVVVSQAATDLANKTRKDPRVVELILQESRKVLRTRPGLIVVEHNLGFVCANAGIDHSNVHGDNGSTEDWVLLLPEFPDMSAQVLREALEEATGVQLGVLIIDSHGRAWRMGTVGITIGISGLPGVVDLRGQPDLFGYKLRVSEVGAADELAAAASLVMGQAAEGYPVVHARGFPYPRRESELSELIRPEEQDLFR